MNPTMETTMDHDEDIFAHVFFAVRSAGASNRKTLPNRARLLRQSRGRAGARMLEGVV